MYSPGGVTAADAVPSEIPQLAGVDVKDTTKEAGVSVTVTLACCVQEVPVIETVTVYVPADKPVACGPVCPLDQRNI